MATLYFNNATLDADWNTLANWWADSSCTIPASSLPTSSDDVVIFGRGDEEDDSIGSPAIFNLGNSGPDIIVNNISFLSINPNNNIFIHIESSFSGSITALGEIITDIVWFAGSNIIGDIVSNGSNIGGNITGNITMNPASIEVGANVTGNITLNGCHINPADLTVNGDVICNDNSSVGTGNISITGTATFNDTSVNSGNITGDCVFNDYSINGQIITDEENNIVYIGNIIGNCTFNDSSINWGSITGDCVLNNYETWGMITGNCTFNPASNHYGIIYGDAVFNSAVADGGIVYGTATFNGNSLAVGTSDYAIFNDNTITDCGVIYDCIFNDNSYANSITCGSATFNDASYHSLTYGASIGNLILGTRTPYPLRSGINNSNILELI